MVRMPEMRHSAAGDTGAWAAACRTSWPYVQYSALGAKCKEKLPPKRNFGGLYKQAALHLCAFSALEPEETGAVSGGGNPGGMAEKPLPCPT